MIKPVFIYAILSDSNKDPMRSNGNTTIGFKVIESAEHDYIGYSSAWMDDNELGRYCLIPGLDIANHEYLFWVKDYNSLQDCEQAAFSRMADLYASQTTIKKFNHKGPIC